MGFINIVFPGHVSNQNMSALVVELVQYILFMRGQFPFTFEEGKKYINELRTRHGGDLQKTSEQKDYFEAFSDPADSMMEKPVIEETMGNVHFLKPRQLKKAETQLIQSVLNFESYFKNLDKLLESNEIQEVVLNFGHNFRAPKELFHIKLFGRCTSSDCGEKILPFDYCKRYLFRALVGKDGLFEDLPTEILFPISVMLLGTSDMVITEGMEQKPSYSVPVKKRLCEVELSCKCQHPCYDLKTSEESSDCGMDTFAEDTSKLSLGDEGSSSSVKSSLWVQLKPALKGFRDGVSPKYDTVLL